MADRHKTVEFFKAALGYSVQTEFDIDFPDGSMAKCFALEPPEKTEYSFWSVEGPCRDIRMVQMASLPEYHTPPEIFVSDGTPDSVVGQWVAKRDGIGGIHHLAYQVDSVQAKMDEWREKGFAEFTTENPLVCPGLVQVFTKPSALTGVIYEFIERGQHGFCKDNVRQLMMSTAETKVASDFPESTIESKE